MSVDMIGPVLSPPEPPRTTELVPQLAFDDICKRDTSGRIIEITLSANLDTAQYYGRVVPLSDHIAVLTKALDDMAADRDRTRQMAYGPTFTNALHVAQQKYREGFSHINVAADLRVYPEGVFYRPGEPIQPLKKYQEPATNNG